MKTNNKIFVYTNEIVLARKAFHVAFSRAVPDSDPNDFIIVRDIKSHANKVHSATDEVYVTNETILKKRPSATLINISEGMSTDEKKHVILALVTNIEKFKKDNNKDTSIIDLNIGSLPEILDKNKIAGFIEQYKRAYKKPIVIVDNDGKNIGIFDSKEDFAGQEEKYDILLTVDEYVMVMLSVLGFNAKLVTISRSKEQDF